MEPLLRLDSMLSEYQPLFKYKNFNHFRTFVLGLINTPHRGTMTQIYQHRYINQSIHQQPIGHYQSFLIAALGVLMILHRF